MTHTGTVRATDALRERRQMTPDEIDAFLVAQRLCRCATIGAGELSNTTLWYVWHERVLWISINPRKSRWSGLHNGPVRGPRASVVVDVGEYPGEIRIVELRGRLRLSANRRPVPADVERLFALRYRQSHNAERYAWAYLEPRTTLSWRT